MYNIYSAASSKHIYITIDNIRGEVYPQYQVYCVIFNKPACLN